MKQIYKKYALFACQLLSIISAGLITSVLIIIGKISRINNSYVEVAIILSRAPLYFSEKLRYYFKKILLSVSKQVACKWFFL
jgi:hypothetical protein